VTLIERIGQLSAQIESSADPAVSRAADELVATMLEMYGEGLRRVLEPLDEGVRLQLAEDDLVASLLLIHDLHPVPLEQRVQAGLDEVRPYMKSHGGGVELLGIEEGVARLRLDGSCDGCAASASTLELAVEKALEEAAPDLLGIEVEGVLAEAGPEVTGVGLPMVMMNGGAAAPPKVTGWQELDGATDVAPGALGSFTVDGEALLVANVDGELLAYHDSCAGCQAPLSTSTLSEGVLACPSCERRFFLPRAGRSLDDDRIQLAPVPLLRENGSVARVALHA